MPIDDDGAYTGILWKAGDPRPKPPMTGEDAFRIANFGLQEAADPPRYSTGNNTETLCDRVIDSILAYPKEWGPGNICYRKTHVSAPGTVRSWFRQMRAADFERDVEMVTFGSDVPTWEAHEAFQGWTLFDTQKVIDRETAAYYLKPDVGSIYFVQGGRVVGSIVNVALPAADYPKPGDPDYVRRECGADLLQDITTCYERGGQPEWDHTDYSRDVQWLGIERPPMIRVSAPRDDFGFDRFVLWVADPSSARLTLVDSCSKTEAEADTAARTWLADHPRGVVYILKAISILEVLRSDSASIGAGRAPRQ